MSNTAIYLKVNREREWALRNVHIWEKVALSLGYDTYIICDKPEVETELKKLEFAEYFSIIESIKSDYARELIEKITIPHWNNAAYAHMTTFLHSKSKGYRRFWNIDADDTFMCLPIDRICQLVEEVEKYAENNSIDCFSLDMWYSRLYGKDWSFGITYTRANIDWMKIFEDGLHTYAPEKKFPGNIDNFFYCLREKNKARIETWYCENLRFIHYTDDMMTHFIQSGIYHWKDGVLYSPLTYFVGEKEKEFRSTIVSDTVRLDIDIKDYEIFKTMLYYSADGHVANRLPDMIWDDVEGSEIIRKRKIRFHENIFHKKDVEYILFGTGNFFRENYEKIAQFITPRYASDNDIKKQGLDICGMRCIAPEDMMKIDNAVAIIMIFDFNISAEISKMLEEMGIPNIHFWDWVVGWKRTVFSDNNLP